ncbi:class I SAM-dependent methyltransferase [Actinoplanes sp. NPDC023714]|uniref:class I SAM-dependent methyltransferase n=1 Tax=Actinoplanes sp. NPDC023714 TaxID=3154322 RepID=UPI0033DCFEC5
MSVRALSFGAVAEAYERFRPGYPGELADLVADYAGRPIRTALEIGAGTGKATRLFAARGIAVTATEPDAGMLTELHRLALPNVTPMQSGFEELSSPGTFDLVYAAAALHWTRPEGRWPRIAGMLVPGGVFACFGGPLQLSDPALEEDVRTAQSPYLEGSDIPSPDGTPPDAEMQWPGTELLQSDLFTDVQQHVLERPLTMTARDYVSHLSTISAYIQLPAGEQDEVYRRIELALPPVVELTADIWVHLARRR